MAVYKRWQPSELEFINNNKDVLSDKELAIKLSQITGNNITMSMIRRQRRKLGISKPRGRRKSSVVLPGQEHINKNIV